MLRQYLSGIPDIAGQAGPPRAAVTVQGASGQGRRGGGGTATPGPGLLR